MLPHFIVLFFLFVAFVVLTIVAFFAILFTGRYPRSIFDFNLGVLRWAWSVGFYTHDALGTDGTPAVTGLLLVKWWLLAIPHYLILSIFRSVHVGIVLGR